MLKRQDKMEGNLSRQIEKLQAATEARIDKGEKDLEKLENRFNDFVRDIPRNYVDKETWMVQNQTMDRKLDRITEEIMKLGRRENA